MKPTAAPRARERLLTFPKVSLAISWGVIISQDLSARIKPNSTKQLGKVKDARPRERLHLAWKASRQPGPGRRAPALDLTPASAASLQEAFPSLRPSG